MKVDLMDPKNMLLPRLRLIVSENDEIRGVAVPEFDLYGTDYENLAILAKAVLVQLLVKAVPCKSVDGITVIWFSIYMGARERCYGESDFRDPFQALKDILPIERAIVYRTITGGVMS